MTLPITMDDHNQLFQDHEKELITKMKSLVCRCLCQAQRHALYTILMAIFQVNLGDLAALSLSSFTSPKQNPDRPSSMVCRSIVHDHE